MGFHKSYSGCDRLHSRQKILSFAERSAQFGQRTILQLTNPLARDAEIFADVLQSLRPSSVKTKPLRNDLLLALVEEREQRSSMKTSTALSQWIIRRVLSVTLASSRTFNRSL